MTVTVTMRRDNDCLNHTTKDTADHNRQATTTTTTDLSHPTQHVHGVAGELEARLRHHGGAGGAGGQQQQHAELRAGVQQHLRHVHAVLQRVVQVHVLVGVVGQRRRQAVRAQHPQDQQLVEVVEGSQVHLPRHPVLGRASRSLRGWGKEWKTIAMTSWGWG